MIDSKTKNKFLKELEKNGNVFWSCTKTGIHHSTYYRWIKIDKEFEKLAKTAIRHGRENNTDIGEHALMLKVKDKCMDAIKYLLSHNSSRYKRQVTNAIIIHKKDLLSGPPKEKTLEDLLVEGAQNNRDLAEKYMKMGGIPPKSDGSPIEGNELSEYRVYIDEWYKKKELDEKAEKESESNNQTNEDSDSEPTSI